MNERRVKLPSPDRAKNIARRRYKATRRAGYPKRWPDEIAAEQKWHCYYCGKNMCKSAGPQMRTLDHKVPLSRGGQTRRANLVAACYSCNQSKAGMTAEEFFAQAIEAGTGETREAGLDAKHESAVPNGDAP